MIEKQLLLGFIYTVKKEDGGEYIKQIPVASRYNWMFNPATSIDEDFEASCLDNEKVVSVLPVPFPSYEIWYTDNSNEVRIIGYEYPGMPEIDWEKEVKRLLNEDGLFR